MRHTLHKLDPDLQAAHARFPFAVVWDDHEVQNDYSGLAPEFSEPSPEFAARRAAAYQAYYEHMPIRLRAALMPAEELRIYRRLRYGRLAEFTMLDDRQYRTDNPCGDGESLRCDEAINGDYTMLGRGRSAGCRDGSSARRHGGTSSASNSSSPSSSTSRTRTSAIGTTPGTATPAPASACWRRGRQRLRNPVFLTGDWHSTFVNDLKLDFKNPSSPTVATEFVTPAITTGGDGTPYGPYYGPMIPYNPHIKYFEGDKRGYFMATATRGSCDSTCAS